MSWEIREGHVLDQLRAMPDESVQTVVTSPPYWGLRDYGVDGQLGLEATPEEFVAGMVEVFAEVRRVLRDDGTLWLNIGDCYATGAGKVGDHPGGGVQGKSWKGAKTQPNRLPLPGLKPKDLVGIPWMLAFALRADGWYLRADVIWSKSNPMPESVADRPTKSHEYVFLLTKAPRYFYDVNAIREPHTMRPQRRPGGRPEDSTPRPGHPRQSWSTASRDGVGVDGHPAGRNKRSVWSIATRPFPPAHFATFPPDLVVPCVLAGAPRECCSECGAPWQRVVDRQTVSTPSAERVHREGHVGKPPQQSGHHWTPPSVTELGWSPSCDHDTGGGVPVVLDPFAGAGTTLLVAEQLGRDSIGIELNPEYAAMARDRIRRWQADPGGKLKAEKPAQRVDGQLDLIEEAA